MFCEMILGSVAISYYLSAYSIYLDVLWNDTWICCYLLLNICHLLFICLHILSIYLYYLSRCFVKWYLDLCRYLLLSIYLYYLSRCFVKWYWDLLLYPASQEISRFIILVGYTVDENIFGATKMRNDYGDI